LEPEARDQRYDHCDPEADRKGPGIDGKSREKERELSWRPDCRRRAPCGCSFRSSPGYCHVHFDFPSLNSQHRFIPPCERRPIGTEQCSGLLTERGAVLLAIWFGSTGDGG